MNRLRIVVKNGVGEIGCENQRFLQTTDSKVGNERAEKTFAGPINKREEVKKPVEDRHRTDTFRHTAFNDWTEIQYIMNINKMMECRNY